MTEAWTRTHLANLWVAGPFGTHLANIWVVRPLRNSVTEARIRTRPANVWVSRPLRTHLANIWVVRPLRNSVTEAWISGSTEISASCSTVSRCWLNSGVVVGFSEDTSSLDRSVTHRQWDLHTL